MTPHGAANVGRAIPFPVPHEDDTRVQDHAISGLRVWRAADSRRTHRPRTVSFPGFRVNQGWRVRRIASYSRTNEERHNIVTRGLRAVYHLGDAAGISLVPTGSRDWVRIRALSLTVVKSKCSLVSVERSIRTKSQALGRPGVKR